MTTLLALLPVAISGLIGVIVGFKFARIEREQHRRHQEELKKAESAFREHESQAYFPFVASR
jgi:hypothetical protein